MSYNPQPTRVWSRVQNPCTFIVPGDEYLSAFIPLTGQTVSQAEADYEMKQLYKGNILQYKGNSARLTKSQKYSQLARCAGPSRTKVFATQSETYTNPNTTGLLRQNFATYPFPNQLVGEPNNISGPFAYGIPNPDGCSGNSVQDGGTLVYGTYVNPCSNEIIKKCSQPATICNPASASNVPGTSILCWNKKVQTWFPKQRYFMNNSTDKWPVNYKGFVSAVRCSQPGQPTLSIQSYNSVILNNINFKMDDISILRDDIIGINKDIITTETISNDITIILKPNFIFPIDSFNIYIDGELYKNIKNDNTYKYTLTNINKLSCILQITSLINGVESPMSNEVLFEYTPVDKTPLPSIDDENNNDFNYSNIINLLNKIDQNVSYGLIDIVNLNSNINSKMNEINNSITMNKEDLMTHISSSIDHQLDNITNTLDTKLIPINSKIDEINDTITMNKEDLMTHISSSLDHQLYNINNTLDTKLTPINNSINTISSLMTDLLSTTTNIFNKVSLYGPCGCCRCSNVDTSGCCGCSNVDTSGCCGCSNVDSSGCNCEFYNVLFNSDVITNIHEYIFSYISTIYDDTDTYIPIDIYNNLQVKLASLEDLFAKTDPSCGFNNIIHNYKNILSLVKSAFEQKNLAKSTLINSEIWRQDSLILHDPDKLKEFIDNLNKSLRLIDFGITSSRIILKQQYAMYHNRYGVPDNLNYDPQLMKPILEILKLA
jgi:hypothetical protein